MKQLKRLLVMSVTLLFTLSCQDGSNQGVLGPPGPSLDVAAGESPSSDPTVATAFTRTYHWTIAKSADPGAGTLALNQSFAVNYTVTVTNTGFTDVSSQTSDEVDRCIMVFDSSPAAGFLGEVCVGDAPGVFTYQETIGPFADCGAHTVVNTAIIIGTEAHAFDEVSVAVHVPCVGGCTLTIGYWKTHAGFTGNNADTVTPLLPILLGSGGGTTLTVSTATQAVSVLRFEGSNGSFSSSNGINKLYAQLLGAKLNIANGADGSAIAATIAAADGFLATNNSTNWAGLSRAGKNQVLGWMAALDDYNNGLIGPGHCSEGNGGPL